MDKKLKYMELMEENNLTLNDLPKEIKTKINALKPTIARYNNSNPPSEALEKAIIKQDIGIFDLIADYIERELPEYVEEEKEVVEATIPEGAVVDATIEEPEIVEPIIEVIEPVVLVPIIEERKKKDGFFGTLEMEDKILDECKSNGYISGDKLSAITGKSKWQLSVSEERIFSIVLKKVYQKDLFKLNTFPS